MRWYWTKIGLGAFAIFAVGLGLISAVRGTKHAIEEVAHAETVSIPLPFVPFVLDGSQVGKFRRVTLHRSEGGELKGVDISVRLEDASALAAIAPGCSLTVDDAHRIGSTTASFHCATSADGVRPFGEISVQVRDADGDWVTRTTYPFVIPAESAPRFGEAELASNAAEVEAERIRELADSIAAVSGRMAQATSEERAELRSRLRELRSEMRDVERAVSQMSSAVRRVQVRAPGVRIDVPVEVDVPDVKVEVSVPEAPKPPSGSN
ncbi:MAG: hypothetical protein AB7R55_10275 [Gemmatimonadales bacterium]